MGMSMTDKEHLGVLHSDAVATLDCSSVLDENLSKSEAGIA